MPGPLITLTLLAVCLGLIALMWLGWRARRRRQSSIAAAPELPAGLGEPVFALDDVHYVATSTAGAPLDRIAVEPLGFRGRAVVEVHPTGLAVGIAATRPFFVPRERIEEVGRAQGTGTRTVFRPDPTIFRVLDYKWDTLVERFREMAFLTRGLEIVLTDERTGREMTFCFEGGVTSFVRYLNRGRKVLHEPFHVEKQVDDTLVEVALQYTDGYNESTYAFANNINTVDGGTHLTGFRTALTRTLND